MKMKMKDTILHNAKAATCCYKRELLLYRADIQSDRKDQHPKLLCKHCNHSSTNFLKKMTRQRNIKIFLQRRLSPSSSIKMKTAHCALLNQKKKSHLEKKDDP